MDRRKNVDIFLRLDTRAWTAQGSMTLKLRARSIAADCTAVLGVGLLILGWQYAPQEAADFHPEQE